jgi:exopolysaccharide biosynthesis polyprenyl glycosylphosphotransferase
MALRVDSITPGAPQIAVATTDHALGALHSLGPDIPRHFLWIADILLLMLAFETGYMLAPVLKAWFLSHPSIFSGSLGILAPAAGGEYRPISEALWVFPVMSAVTLLALQALGGYRPLQSQSRARIILSTVAAPLTGLSAVAVVLFALRTPSWSRLFIFLFASAAGVLLCGYRLTLHGYRRRRGASGFYARSVVLIAPPQGLEWLIRYFARFGPEAYEVAGYMSLGNQPPPESPASGTRMTPLAHLGAVENFASILVHRPVHEVVAVAGARQDLWLRDVIDACAYFRVTLRIVPEALLFGQQRDVELTYHADSLRLPEVVLAPKDFSPDALFAKRLIDVLVSGMSLLLLSPLFLAIAIAIKLTTPALSVFYRWDVVGYKGRRFRGFKFSTMVADADARRRDLLDRNEMQGPVFKIKTDPRVTPLGRILRKFSLNELPQLWSVLRGDMSLVGPRPAFPHELERYELWQKRKLCVRPGITCLWQVRGRNRISSFDDWVRMDLEYIDQWSLWLDFKILARTVWAVLAGTGS